MLTSPFKINTIPRRVYWSSLTSLVASVSVWFRCRERPGTGFSLSAARKRKHRSLLLNRTETLATQATHWQDKFSEAQGKLPKITSSWHTGYRLSKPPFFVAQFSALPSLWQFGRGRLSLVAISFYALSLLFGSCRLSEFTLVGPQ